MTVEGWRDVGSSGSSAVGASPRADAQGLAPVRAIPMGYKRRLVGESRENPAR